MKRSPTNIISGEDSENEDSEDEIISGMDIDDSKIDDIQEAQVEKRDREHDNPTTLMSASLAQTIHSSFHRIKLRFRELAENQVHLIEALEKQNQTPEHIQTLEHQISLTMSQLPHYSEALVQAQHRMMSISQRMEKLNQMTQELRVETQSRALAREEQKDSRSQWNNLFVAKESSQMKTFTTTTTTTVVNPDTQATTGTSVEEEEEVAV